MIAWSYSRLTDFESCPLMFQHKYVLKTIKFETNAAMERGKELHGQLERSVLRAVAKTAPVQNDVSHVYPMIEAFVAKHQSVLVEQQMAFTKLMKPCSWFSKETYFRAIVDLAGIEDPFSELQNQKAMVLDWKSGRYNVNMDQLKLYNLAMFRSNPLIQTVSSALVFIDQKKTSPPLTSQRFEMSSIEDEFFDRAEAIQIAEQQDLWPAKRNDKCRWCGIQDCQYKR